MLSIQQVSDAVKEFFLTYLIEPVKGIGVKDVIDILLLSFVLFFVYRLIRDSRAWKLLLGLGLVFIMSVAASAFEMNGLNFIFGNFQQLGIIAILVLFQPELRMMLERVGNSPVNSLKNIALDSTSDLAALNAQIDAISTAVNDLSRDKVGALIVIERSSNLGEYIKSGVYIDAAISPYILRNIFFNKAPLHDGAVIIRDGRICAAGCFLPLSTKEDINKELGTRHRAAIGMTEISDALVVVVSEETGTVSLSLDGNLERGYNYRTLKQALIGYLAPESTAQTEKTQNHHHHRKYRKDESDN